MINIVKVLAVAHESRAEVAFHCMPVYRFPR